MVQPQKKQDPIGGYARSPLRADHRGRPPSVREEVRGANYRIRRIQRSSARPFFSAQDLRDIVAGEPLAVVLEGFYTPEEGRAIAERLQRASWTRYSDEIPIGRVGDPLFDCFGETSCDRYFESAPRSRAMIQEALSPYANPADLIQKELDLVWPLGCNVFTIGGRKCFVGLPRSFGNGGEALPHTDVCGWDWPCADTEAVQAQLAINAYLTMAEVGGELELWDTRPTREHYDAMRDGYGLQRALLSEASTVLRPAAGEVIIFNASKIHAVRASTGGGERVTVSGFIGYRGEDRPLVVFS
jgi:2-oxoglutarate-Fe(II)-dependent oxygenase superfamily protein